MPSPAPADAHADLLARRRDLILAGDADGFAALFAPDAVIEVPFSGAPGAPDAPDAPGTPMRLEGRPAIHAFARHAMASLMRIDDFEVTEAYQTQDPEVVVVEMRTNGTIATTGRSFSVRSVQILRIRDGLITSFRDYADPRIAAEVLEHRRPES